MCWTCKGPRVHGGSRGRRVSPIFSDPLGRKRTNLHGPCQGPCTKRHRFLCSTPNLKMSRKPRKQKTTKTTNNFSKGKTTRSLLLLCFVSPSYYYLRNTQLDLHTSMENLAAAGKMMRSAQAPPPSGVTCDPFRRSDRKEPPEAPKLRCQWPWVLYVCLFVCGIYTNIIINR